MKMYLILLSCFVALCGQFATAQSDFEKHDDLFHHYLYSNPDSALYELKQQANSSKTRTEQIQFYHNSALVCINNRLFDSTASLLSSAQNYILTEDHSLQACQYELESYLMFKQSQFKTAIDILQKTRPLLPLINQTDKNRIFLKCASSYMRIGEIDSAYFFAQQVLKTAVDTSKESELLRASAYSNIGQLYLYKGNLDSSFSSHYQALNLYEKHQNINGTGISFAEMAGIKLFQQKFDESRHYYKKAIVDFKRLDKPCYSLYTNIGTAYHQLSEPDSATYYLKLAYNGGKAISRIDIQGNAAGTLANVFMDLEMYDSASFYYNQAMTFFTFLGHTTGVALCKMGLANSHTKKGDFSEANRYLNESFKIVDSLQNINSLKEYYELEYEVFAAQEEYEKALVSYQSFTKLKDSILTINNEKQIEELEIQYNLKLVNQENAELKTKARIRAENIRKTRYIYWLITAVLVGLLLLLFFISLSRKRKLQLKKVEIEQSKLQEKLLLKKLSDAKNAILSKNQLLAELEEKINKDVDYTEISAKLLNKVNLTQEWAEFTVEFTALFNNFFANLTKISRTNLTKNELRLCSLIKLNLSNKEIAALLFISTDAVKKAKNRLTKKIILAEDESLTSKISSL